MSGLGKFAADRPLFEPLNLIPMDIHFAGDVDGLDEPGPPPPPARDGGLAEVRQETAERHQRTGLRVDLFFVATHGHTINSLAQGWQRPLRWGTAMDVITRKKFDLEVNAS